MKHIESILPEYAASEIDRMLVGDDDATATAALTALLHSVTGCAIPQTSDLPESEVEELVPLCVSILRRHWQTPLTCLGDGNTPMSLSDLMRQAIGDRVQGNEALSIPPANANIATAVAALRQRDMSSGLTLTLPAADADGSTDGSADASPTTMPLPDGLSLAQLLCGKGDLLGNVVEIIDDNIGWTMSKNLPTNITGSLTKLRLGCAYVLNWPSGAYLPTTLTEIEFPELISWGITSEYRPLFIYNNPNITELTFPKCKAIGNGFTYADTATTGCFISTCENLRVVRFPEMYKYGAPEAGFGATYEDNYGTLVYGCNNLEELYLPKWTGYRSWRIVQHCTNLKKLVLGNITSGVPALYKSYAYPFSHCVNLIHLEFAGVQVSLNLSSYNPTSVLSDSAKLPIFLSNFKTYIAERLSEQGSGKTITLSQAVRDAIEGDPTIAQIITSKGWTISPAPTA